MKFPYNIPTHFRSIHNEDGGRWACMYFDLEDILVWADKKYPLAELLFEETLETWA